MTQREYGLTLYINGASDRSAVAIVAARRMCDEELAGQCQLTIVDITVHPEALDRIGATPTLVRDRPLPMRRVVGDVTDTHGVMAALELTAAPLSRSS